MSDSPPRPRLAELLARLTAPKPDHASFQGPPIDITGITAFELGRLWSAIQKARLDFENRPAFEAARSILQQARQLELIPALDEESLMESMRATRVGDLQSAVEHLACMVCAPPEWLASELRRILGDSAGWAEKRFQAFALTRLIGDVAVTELRARVREKYAEASYLLREFDVLAELGTGSVLSLASAAFVKYYWPGTERSESDPADVLANDAAYIELAVELLEKARQRVEDIHSGKVPYVADGAFSVEDSSVIARAARVASLRDEPWFGEIILSLFPKACVAPTEAKTAPSQSLAVALGHSVQGVPTPESVQALREALRVVRHAGVKKKLSRNLKPAERALAERPELALRLAMETKPSKAQLAMLATCLEAGFCTGLELGFEEWRARLVGSGATIGSSSSSNGGVLARSLIWRAQVGSQPAVSFMLDGSAKTLSMIDCTGKPVRVDEASRISLWHPMHSDEAERDAWRSLVSARQVRQPIRQAYREHYYPIIEEGAIAEELASHESEMFAGFKVSIRPLIGLARRQGWRIDEECGLIREFGNVQAIFSVGAELYPGLEGWCEAGLLRLLHREGKRWTATKIADVPPVVFSEICRAVDLLVSVTTFAIEDGTSSTPLTAGGLGVRLASGPAAPISSGSVRLARERRLGHLAGLNFGEMARMRREVLKRAFAREIAAGNISMDERHVRVGPYAVHLATARVTRDGAAIELELAERGPKLAAVPWLPYDESLLQKIVSSVGMLLVDSRGGA